MLGVERHSLGGRYVTASVEIDYTNWDWLPRAASEFQAYLVRLLAEQTIKPHDVSARAKSIASFQRKAAKPYEDPVGEITDTVAVRVITFSITDRDRIAEIIKDRFVVKPGEDRNPGLEKSERRRGYDCWHIVITGEKQPESGWLIERGDLSRYFNTFGGLEVQLRTVAAHAWAEFEHARRYKGRSYDAVTEQDRETIDQLFGAASDARRALDETFVAIDRILAHPTSSAPQPELDEETPLDEGPAESENAPLGSDGLSENEVADLLRRQFPGDKEASESGMHFACELLSAVGYTSVQALEDDLLSIDSDQVRSLMDYEVPVTRVRRLDDDLLSLHGEKYIRLTADLGNVRSRAKQLEWRFDRLRGKTGYSRYSLEGSDCPPHLLSKLLPAAAAVRAVVMAVSRVAGPEAAVMTDIVSLRDDLPKWTRAKAVVLEDGGVLYVATNLNREASERIISDLLSSNSEVDLRVIKDGRALISPSSA